MNASTDYPLLAAQAEALLSVTRNPVTNAANLSALIFEQLPQVNWVGFYFVEDGNLLLGPFQGKPACVHIPWGKGVCGTAAASRISQRVADVHAFDGHIVCDGDSRSELVIPLLRDGEVFGVLDIDSPITNRFGESDEAGMARLADIYLRSIA